GLRLQQRRPTVGRRDAVTLRFCRLPGDAAGVERLARAVELRRRELEQTIELEQRLARLALERAPRRERLAREPHPVRLGIGEPEDPRAAVARAAPVVELELLEDAHVVAVARKRPRSGGPRDSRSDDGDAHGAYPAVVPGTPHDEVRPIVTRLSSILEELGDDVAVETQESTVTFSRGRPFAVLESAP